MILYLENSGGLTKNIFECIKKKKTQPHEDVTT